MTKSLNDKLKELPKSRREHVLAAADRQHATYLTLQELRKAKHLSQVQLAERLNIRQATVAQMEKRSDLMLSTLRNHIEAMGGRLNLMVEFPQGAPVYLEGFGEPKEPPIAGSKWIGSAHAGNIRAE